MGNICFEPIGFVSSHFTRPKDLVIACEKGMKTKTSSKIIIEERFASGLEGLEEFSHVFVLYYLDMAERIELKTHPGPPSVKGLPKVGVFASRSQYRPNKIALRLARIVKIEKNVLHVEGLDAVDNSPVLDIKPYVSGFDRPKEFKTASWYDWLIV
ncbi:MAG: tRNA (N6-threonylcarbamoyladenosine(37)-N6)-methyltransferase TrmO [Candidatus Aenigmarchaeota archaeon]|nr:tRNA (N6-threonylcarbamoyladenosine(37)-N6)-methyltransferase TrmO [Candidatus Aenigmarchaeota archaeon]